MIGAGINRIPGSTGRNKFVSRDAIVLASLVKAKLSETAHLAATEAIQMHGGIGMTDEFDIGFFLKRVRILETLYGDRYEHLDRFALLRGY